MPVNRDRRVTFDKPRGPVERLPLPAPGTALHLPKPIETFGGFIRGEVSVSQSYYDFYGIILVNLARGGRDVVTVIQWPLK